MKLSSSGNSSEMHQSLDPRFGPGDQLLYLILIGEIELTKGDSLSILFDPRRNLIGNVRDISRQDCVILVEEIEEGMPADFASRSSE